MATRIDRQMFYVRNNQFDYVFQRNWIHEKEPMNLKEVNFRRDNGSDNLKFIGPIPSSLGEAHTVDNTLYRLSDNEFMLTTVGGQLPF